jgi:FkbM family methyltransferase
MKNYTQNNFPLIYKFIIKLGRYFIEFSRKSYSQNGEDLVLSTFLDIDNIKNGFYIDVGAYQPKKFSNTYFYYKKGWNGINIDAKPGSMKLFKKQRARDINLEVGISKEEGNLDLYIFNESAYNTFSKELADSYKSNEILFDKKVMVKTMKLESIFNKFLPINKKIDFMTIDAEGFDLEVLESNNWDKYKPGYVLIEMHNIDISNIKESNIYKFLTNKGYKLISVVYITLFFKYEA